MYFSSNALARKMEKLALESWKPVGLSPSHAYLLMLVIEKPGIQPGELVDQLLLTPSTITRLVEKLEEKKFVTRTSVGKTTTIQPTARAKQLAPKLQACLKYFVESYHKILGKEESARLVQSMNLISDKLKN